eukprot:1248366-Rhodomonas_salina.2
MAAIVRGTGDLAPSFPAESLLETVRSWTRLLVSKFGTRFEFGNDCTRVSLPCCGVQLSFDGCWKQWGVCAGSRFAGTGTR